MQIIHMQSKLNKIIGYFCAVCILCIRGFVVDVTYAEVLEAVKVSNLQHVKDLVAGSSFVGAGQFDTRFWLYTSGVNGFFKTTKPTTYWPAQTDKIAKAGVVELKYKDKTLLASSAYTDVGIENSLFISKDEGETFMSIGKILPTYSADYCNNTYYQGSSSGRLFKLTQENFNTKSWEALNLGTNFVEKIYKVTCLGNKLIVNTEIETFISQDGGSTFTKNLYLSGQRIRTSYIDDSIAILGTHNYGGSYISRDGLNSWSKLAVTENANVGDISELGGIIYILLIYPGETNETRLLMGDGNRWEVFSLSPKLYMFGNLVAYYDNGPKILYSDQTSGIHSVTPPIPQPSANPIMGLPWDIKNPETFTDYITSYFDHEYPLLGYNYYAEIQDIASTTTNFLGETQPIPKLYYSSHDGIDFKVPFDTKVLATNSGTASYYYCKDCGHTIKIDHNNGYQSIYMHLQKEDLVTSTYNNAVPVNKGDVIGKVGMTGKTSGPHIHYAVQIDKNLNGSFLDDYPGNKTDPFGWLSPIKDDPWQYYVWQDVLGYHEGSESSYLWEQQIPEVTKRIEETNKNIVLGNKTIDINSQEGTWKITNSFLPKDSPLSFIEGTSVSIRLIDMLGNDINSLVQPITLTIDITDAILSYYDAQSIKIYTYNNQTSTWEAIVSSLDVLTKTVSAQLSHLSDYAVFAKPKQIPTTKVKLAYLDNIVYLYYENNSEPENTSLIYSLDGQTTWEQYRAPVSNVEITGSIFYTTIDTEGNLGEIQQFTPNNQQNYKLLDRIIFKEALITTKE